MKGFLAIAILIIFSSSISVFAQTKTKISGTIINAVTQKPVEYATVSVTNIINNKTISGAIADIKGNFSIQGLPYGNYKIVIDFIGYTQQVIDSLKITAIHPTLKTGILKLLPAAEGLQDVVVTSKTPLVENKVDKIVYNAINDVSSQGGVALDVLKKVPQVNVDIDGNVELQGNANIRFLINGKPSTVFGNSVTDALASIPASQIKSIEAITTPGAKYDAQGTGGIINIILKDSKVKGINGSVNLSAGTRLENASANLNYRHDNFGLNAFFSGNQQLKSRTPYYQNRTSFDSATNATTHLIQNGYTDFKRNGYRTGIGADWNITKKDIVTATLAYHHFGNTGYGFTNQDQQSVANTGNTVSDILSTRNSFSQFKMHAFEWSLDYKKKFKKDGEELYFLYNDSYSKPYATSTQTQTYQGQSTPYTGTSNVNPGTNRETNFSLDFTYPVNDKITLETGGKVALDDITSMANVSAYVPSTNSYVLDSTQSNNFKYNMKVYAAYISASFPLFHFFDAKIGGRLEHTDIHINYAGINIPSYNTFVPSVILSHKFDEKTFVKFAFTRRIERPDYGELNPFLNISDPYNIITGNPYLRPEIGYTLELGYSKTFNNGGNVYFALMERINADDVKPYVTFYPTYKIGDSVYNNVSVTTRQNIGHEYNTGMILTSSLPFFKGFNIRENLMVFNRHVINDLTGGNVTNGLNWRLNMNASYQFSKNLVAEAFGDYRSSFNNIQGKQPHQFSYTIAVRKQFWNKNASIGLTATNPFNKYINQATTITTNNYNSYYLRQVPYQSFGISFSYKFGKLEFKKTKEPDNESNNPPDMGN